MGTPTDTMVVEDEKESAFAIQLLNSMIPEWNYRESRDSPDEWDDSAPVGGLVFISGSEYEVLFRHVGTGRVYGIVAPGSDLIRLDEHAL